MYIGFFKYILLVVGFLLLVKGSDYFVDGSSSIAKRFNISNLVIGLTIVAMGTSAPELSVSILASLNGANEVAVSNVIGSNLFNMLAIIGICAIIKPMTVKTRVLKNELPFSILVHVILLVMCADVFLSSFGNGTPVTFNEISRSDGIVLFLFFLMFMYSILISLRSTNTNEESIEPTEEITMLPLNKSIIYIIVGLFAIIFGGKFVVNSAVSIAIDFNISQTLIGLTIVSIGTSLPELVTSVTASRKGNSDIALGNVVGSNIFNILFILGTSSIISPISIAGENIIDGAILCILSLVIFTMAITKKTVSRFEGIVILAIYISYTVYIIYR